jgi:hypothetical protein
MFVLSPVPDYTDRTRSKKARIRSIQSGSPNVALWPTEEYLRDAFSTWIVAITGDSTPYQCYFAVGHGHSAMVRRPDRQLLNVLAGYDRPVAGLVLALREIVLEEAPDAVERMYSNHPSAVWFGSGPKMKDMFCYIAAASSHVNLGFCRGASLSDPNRVLEGEGKTMRHIKFGSESDVERPFVRRYIRSAIG